MKRTNPAACGFTLIELLIVIAIMCILAAILFPVFAAAREKARQIACLSNQRQIGFAILQYVQDNDTHFPNGINPTNGWFWAGEGWAGQVSSYVKNPGLYRCPDDPTIAVGGANYAVSYGYNINLVASQDGGAEYSQDGYYFGAPPPGIALSDLSAPARSVALFEVSGVAANAADPREGAGGGKLGSAFSAAGNGLDHRLYANNKAPITTIDNDYATGYLGARLPPNPASTQFRPALGRHADGANYLLADGHVRWLRGSRVSSGLNAAAESDAQGAGFSGFSAAGTATDYYTATFSIR